MKVPGIPDDKSEMIKQLQDLLRGFSAGPIPGDNQEKTKMAGMMNIEAFKVDVKEEDCENPRDVYEALQRIFTDLIRLAGRLKSISADLEGMLPASITLEPPKQQQKKNNSQDELQQQIKELLKQGDEILKHINKNKGDNE